MQERERQQKVTTEKRNSPERNRAEAGSCATPDSARTERLRELRDAIREGRYAVSAEDLADRILEDLKRGDDLKRGH